MHLKTHESISAFECFLDEKPFERALSPTPAQAGLLFLFFMNTSVISAGFYPNRIDLIATSRCQ
jgi:hypothetical protein